MPAIADLLHINVLQPGPPLHLPNSDIFIDPFLVGILFNFVTGSKIHTMTTFFITSPDLSLYRCVADTAPSTSKGKVA